MKSPGVQWLILKYEKLEVKETFVVTMQMLLNRFDAIQTW